MKLAPSRIRKYTHSTIINWKVSKIGTDGLQADIICAERKAKSTF